MGETTVRDRQGASRGGFRRGRGARTRRRQPAEPDPRGGAEKPARDPPRRASTCSSTWSPTARSPRSISSSPTRGRRSATTSAAWCSPNSPRWRRASCAPGGILHAATDWPDYAEHIAAVFSASDLFEQTRTRLRRAAGDEVRITRTAIGTRGARSGVSSARNSASSSLRKRWPRARRPDALPVALEQAPLFGFCQGALSDWQSGRPVRSSKSPTGKPSTRRSAFSMNSNGSSARGNHAVFHHRARPPGTRAAASRARGARCGRGSRACRARRRRCRGSRRTPSS